MSSRFLVNFDRVSEYLHTQMDEYLPNNELTTHDLFLSRRQKHYSYNTQGLTTTTRQQLVLQRISAIDRFSFLRIFGRHVVLLLNLLSMTIDWGELGTTLFRSSTVPSVKSLEASYVHWDYYLSR